MDSWKRELLERLVRDRTIIFLGYSGRDFDICPELAGIKTVRGAVWLKWKWIENEQRGLNANQARILATALGTVVIEDLHSFLSLLCSRLIPSLGRQSAPVEVRDYFDRSLLPEWRVRILDRLACPRIGISLLRSLPQPRSLAKRSLYASMLGHSGQYRKSARVVESQIADAKTACDKLTYLTNAANAWYVYGARFKSHSYFRRAKKLAVSIGPDAYQRASLSKIELMYWMRRARFCRNIPIRQLQSWVRERATIHYRAAVEIFEGTNLDNLYIVQHDAERIGVAESQLTDRRKLL